MRDESTMCGLVLPECYADAGVLCVVPPGRHRERLGVGFNTAAGVARFAISRDDAVFLRNALDGYLAKWGDQSPKSSDKPSDSGLPQDGQSLVPLARSSSACCAVRYTPSDSSCQMGCQCPEASSRIQNAPTLLGWLYAMTRLMVAPFVGVVGAASIVQRLRAAAQENARA